jgi:hypothetical protein
MFTPERKREPQTAAGSGGGLIPPATAYRVGVPFRRSRRGCLVVLVAVALLVLVIIAAAVILGIRP